MMRAGLSSVAVSEPLFTEPGSSGSVGETLAEQVAIIWVLMWTIQALDWLRLLDAIEIFFDNIVAGFGTAGIMQQPKGTPLALTARGLGPSAAPFCQMSLESIILQRPLSL